MNPNNDQQPINPSATAFSPTPPPQLVSDPGKTMAIIGLVLAFFFAIVGLILSILARKKSKDAGYKNNIAVVGIVLNCLSIAAALVVGVVFIFSIMNPATSNQTLGNDVYVDPKSEIGQGIADLERTEEAYNATNNAKANAQQLADRAENYKQHTGDYTRSISNFDEYSDTKIPSSAEKHVANAIPTQSSGSQAFYQYCGVNSAQVLFYNYSKSVVDSLGLGTKLDGSKSCT